MTDSHRFRVNAAAERYAARVSSDLANKERHLRSAEAWEQMARCTDDQRLGTRTSQRLLDGTYFSERCEVDS